MILIRPNENEDDIYLYYYHDKKKKYPHVFRFHSADKKFRAELYDWIKTCGGKYKVDYIYWALKPTTKSINGPEIHFTENEAAMAFKLRWL